MSQRLGAVLIGITGILLFSTKAVLVKLAYQYEVDTVSLLLLRMTFALPFYLFVIATTGKPSEEISRREYAFVFLFGFLGYYLASYLDFQGLKYIKAGVERLVLFAYPSLVLIISWLFLKQPLLRSQLLAIGVSYVGIVLVFLPELEGVADSRTILGGSLVLLSALSYAAYIVGSGWLIPKFGAKRFTAWCMTISCMLVIAHYALQEGPEVFGGKILSLDPAVYGYALLMAIFATVLPSFFISYTIKVIGANQFAIFGSLGPISTILLAYAFLGERLGWLQVLGGVVVVGGIMIAERRKKARSSQ